MTPMEPVAHHFLASKIARLFSLLDQVLVQSGNTFMELGAIIEKKHASYQCSVSWGGELLRKQLHS